jgi:radical SAM protein with 4Fe4S-binding SPASM domain
MTPAPALEVVQWEVTRRCDQNCRMCCLGGPGNKGEELSTAECLDLIEQFSALGVREVHLFGGEAYLRPDFTLLLRRLASRAMKISLTTGGRRFPVEALCDPEIRPAVEHVLLSIDGLEKTHDALRGTPGGFDAALATLLALRRERLPVGVTSQINRRNMFELETLGEFLARLGVGFWHVQLTEPFGNARLRIDELLQPSDLPGALDILLRIRRSVRRLGMWLRPGNNLGYHGPRSRALRSRAAFGEEYRNCRQGIRYVALQPDGTVKGCASCAAGIDTVHHSVRARSLAAIWNDEASFAWTRRWSPERLWGFCASCEHATLCRAGCIQTSQALFGRPGNNPYCEHRVLWLNARGMREEVVAAPDGTLEVVALADTPRLT